jgi:hypothetical protein
VSGLTLRGLHVRPGQAAKGTQRALVLVQQPGPDTVLEGLDLDGGGALVHGVETTGPLSNLGVAPLLVLRDSVIRRAYRGVVLRGAYPGYTDPYPVGHVQVRGNLFQGCAWGVLLNGAARQVHVVGNRISNCNRIAIQLENLLPGTEHLLVANNTLFENAVGLRLWDSTVRGKDIRVQNNLLLACVGIDLLFLDSGGNPEQERGPGAGRAVAEAWVLGQNWTDSVRPSGSDPYERGRIPLDAKNGNVRQAKIDGINRDTKSPDFLRPAKDSPLATEGASNEDPSLPRYVGALPPEGVDPWDWDRTWRMPKDAQLLTVSKESSGGGKYRTVTDALKDAKPWATVRVLDNGQYEEVILIDRKEQEGVCLDAPRGAALVASPNEPALTIAAVPNVQVRGLGVRGHARGLLGTPLILVRGAASGVVLDGLRLHEPMTAGHELMGIVLQDTQAPPDQRPVIVRRCDIRVGYDGIHVAGRQRPGKGSTCVGVRIENNRVSGATARGIWVGGSVARVQLVGNAVWDCRQRGLQVEDLTPESRHILLANNTVRRCPFLLCAWQNEDAGPLAAGQVEVQNNLFVDATGSDIVIMRGLNKPGDPHELARQWRLAHNGRDLTGVHAGVQAPLQGTDVRLEEPPFAKAGAEAPGQWRPAKDSPLADKGAGSLDASLPTYIGALPPEGIEPWDWDRTWRSRVNMTGEKE